MLTNANFITDAWYIACRSTCVKNAPLSVRISDIPIVLYRNSKSKIIALFDRCAHRGVPLSKGFLTGDNLTCCYHGWQYNEEGKCVVVPELEEGRTIPIKAMVSSFLTKEESGYVWVFLGTDISNSKFLNYLDYQDDQLRTVYNTVKLVKSDWIHMAENVIDGAHLAFVHAGSLDSNSIFFRWSRKFRKNKVHRSEYQIKETERGFIAELRDPKKTDKHFFFEIILPSTIVINMKFGKKIIRVGVHIAPISSGTCKVEHTYSRNFLKAKLFDPIFRKIALKFLNEDVRVVEYLQQTYETYGKTWETSTGNDRLPNYLRNILRKRYSSVSLHESPTETEPERQAI